MSERWVDVSHEALIRSWPRLRGWIEEDRAGLRQHRRLTEAAQEWHKSGDESALYRGARLSQAVEWRERHHPALNELERTFLDAGIALQRQEASVRERRRRRVIFWLSASLVVFAVLAGLAVLQWRQAYRQGQIALARQLAAKADLLSGKPENLFLRLLLATEAMKRLHEVEAESLEVDLALRKVLALLPRHIGRFSVVKSLNPPDVKISPDSRNLIAVDYDKKNGSVWEIATGKELVRIEGNEEGEFSVKLPGKVVRFQMAGRAQNPLTALSADGAYLATEADGDSETVAQVWETDTGREVLRLQLPGTHAYALSANGRYLAVSTKIYDINTNTSSEPITRIWDVHARPPIPIPGSAAGSVIAFSQDATAMATTTGLCEITGDLKQVFSWGHGTFDVVLTSDGGHVAIWTERAGQKQIEVWSRTAKIMTANVPTPGSGYLRAVTPDGRLVILSDYSRHEVQVHDTADKIMVSSAPMDVQAAVVTHSGQHLVASLHEGEDALDVSELGREGGDVVAIAHKDMVRAVGLTPLGDLTTIAYSADELIIRAWNVRTRMEIPERVAQVTGTDAVFAPDGQSFAVMSKDGLEVRRVGHPEPVAKFADARPAAVVWSADGRYLAAQEQQDVRVWELSSPESVGKLALPEWPTAMALSRGGDSLAAVNSSLVLTRRIDTNHYAKLWKVATGKELNDGDSIRFDILALSPDAQYSVTSDLRVIEMKTGTLLPNKLGGSGSTPSNCVISIDGRYMAASSQGVVQIWELKNGREAFRIPTNDRPLALDNESRYLATIDEGNIVRVWFLRQDDLIEEACRRLPRNLSEEEWREYVGDAAYRKTCPKLP